MPGFRSGASGETPAISPSEIRRPPHRDIARKRSQEGCADRQTATAPVRNVVQYPARYPWLWLWAHQPSQAVYPQVSTYPRTPLTVLRPITTLQEPETTPPETLADFQGLGSFGRDLSRNQREQPREQAARPRPPPAPSSTAVFRVLRRHPPGFAGPCPRLHHQIRVVGAGPRGPGPHPTCSVARLGCLPWRVAAVFGGPAGGLFDHRSPERR